MRLKLSIAIAKLAGFASQKLLRKSGATIPGKILLTIYPKALSVLGNNRTIILVSGTNGKTSTTRAVAKSISTLGSMVTNSTGSNLDRGVATALMTRSDYAVLEVDELHLIKVATELKPKAVLLLNLTRDQLHRMHEVKKVAKRWHDLARELPNTTFIGDIDDPFVAYALSGGFAPKKISFGGRPHEDGAVCPACGKYLTWTRNGFNCSCGLTNKNADINLTGESAALRNAQLANIAAETLGGKAIAIDESALERSAKLKVRGIDTKIRLTKNPASWREALQGVSGDKVILILNAREVDGIDTSWLWDIDFSSLKGKDIAVTGERALDMVYRLHVQGIESKEFKDFDSAAGSFTSGSQVDVLAAYTAFYGLVRA
jgi:UDP-N-acetylmuramyl tripeptide synthase